MTATASSSASASRLVLTDVKQEFPPAFKLGPVSLTIEPGETVAFVGGNGAGKSTLFQIMTGNADALSGTVELGGKRLTPDKPEIKRTIGYLPQNLGLPRWATGREVLDYAATLYRLQNKSRVIAEAMEHWDCASYADKPLATLSHGMQKRVGLALATLHDPVFLILDEPFSGLDLFHIKALVDEITRRRAAGHATLLSTHIASYVARLAQGVFTVKRGVVAPLMPSERWQALDELARIRAIEAEFFGPPEKGTP